jgi:hypothetical protein
MSKAMTDSHVSGFRGWRLALLAALLGTVIPVLMGCQGEKERQTDPAKVQETLDRQQQMSAEEWKNR